MGQEATLFIILYPCTIDVAFKRCLIPSPVTIPPKKTKTKKTLLQKEPHVDSSMPYPTFVCVSLPSVPQLITECEQNLFV